MAYSNCYLNWSSQKFGCLELHPSTCSIVIIHIGISTFTVFTVYAFIVFVVDGCSSSCDFGVGIIIIITNIIDLHVGYNVRDNYKDSKGHGLTLSV